MIEDQPIEPLINKSYTGLAQDLNDILSPNHSHYQSETAFNSKFNNTALVLREFNVTLEEGLNYSNREDINRRLRDFQISNKTSNQQGQGPKRSFCSFISVALSDYLLTALTLSEVTLLLIRLFIGRPVYEWVECIEVIGFIPFIIFVSSLFNYLKQKRLDAVLSAIQRKKVLVKRSSKMCEIREEELIPGDIVTIKESDVITVTGVLVAGHVLFKLNDQCYETSNEAMKLLFPMTVITEGTGDMLVLSTKPAINNDNLIIEGIEKGKESELNIEINTLSNRQRVIGLIVSIAVGVVAIGKVVLSLFINNQQAASALETTCSILNGLIIFLTLAIVSIPDSIPLVFSIALSFSIKTMLKDNIIIKHLSKLASIAQMNYLCISQSSILDNKPRVQNAFIFGKKFNPVASNNSNLLHDDILLNTTASIIQHRAVKQVKGTPTEAALVNFILENHAMSLLDNESIWDSPQAQPVFTIPFNSTYNYMLSVYHSNESIGKYIAYLRGSYDAVIHMCKSYHTAMGTSDVNDGAFLSIVGEYKREDYEVMLFARKELNELELKEDFFFDFTITGVVGLSESVQRDIKASIDDCFKLGVKVVMLTEHKLSPSIELCKKIGLMKDNEAPSLFSFANFSQSIRLSSSNVIKEGKVNDCSHENSIALTGVHFNQLSDAFALLETDQDSLNDSFIDQPILLEGNCCSLIGLKPKEKESRQNAIALNNFSQYKSTIANITLLAEATAKDKLLFLSSLNESNPNKSTVGVTLNGTEEVEMQLKADVAFSAQAILGDVVLLNNSFSSVVSSIIQARNIYDNIRKIVQFQLTGIIVTAAYISIANFTSLELPLQSTHLLWLSIIIDILSVIVLSLDKPTPSLFNPAPYTGKLFSGTMLLSIALQSAYQLVALMLFSVYGDFILGVQPDGKASHLKWTDQQGYQSTFIFNLFIFMQLFNLFASRRVHQGEFNLLKGIANNSLFLIVLLSITGLQLLFVNIDWLFYNRALSLYQQLLSVGLASFTIALNLIIKALPLDRASPTSPLLPRKLLC